MMSLDSDGSMRAGVSKNLIGFADGTLDGLDDGGEPKLTCSQRSALCTLQRAVLKKAL